MRCLWLTRFLPYPPFYGGDALYSERLIGAFAASGASVTVMCYAADKEHTAPPSQPGNTEWHVLPAPGGTLWETLLGNLPSIAARFRSPVFAAALEAAFGETAIRDAPWDAVVIDHLGMAGNLDLLERLTAGQQPPPVIVYLSHNHEASVRRLIADQFSGNPAKRLVLKREAAKVARLEARVLDRADIVTANTPEDAALFRADNPVCAPVIITPGYDGPVVRARKIDETTPRRATIVGSFGWIAKQMNLEAFLAAAAPRFAAAGAEIEVLGAMPDKFRTRIERTYPGVLVRGGFDDVAPYLARTRIGLVPERTGGGFKHKVLSYAFCRVPVAALGGSVAGMPLTAGDGILYAPDMDALAKTCLAAMDDFALLNRLQNNTFTAVEHAFDWDRRGKILAEAIGSRTRGKTPT